MDCVACGKPISITAKFCGKCGAPVKRNAKPAEAPLVNETSVETSDTSVEVRPVDEMSFTLSPPEHMADMREIDLELPPTISQASAPPAAAPSVNSLAPTPIAATETPYAPTIAAKEVTPSMDPDRLKALEQTQQEIKKTLEKHSLLLDFISLTSQQQNHQQTQPDPLEPLVSQVAEQQTSLQSQLTQLAALLSQNEAQQHSQRMPDEFKLQLEKQKIEIHKLLAQSLAQNNENLKDDQHEVIEHLEKRVDAYHQAAQQSMEKNMGALASGMSELKTQLQALQKKTAEKSTAKSSSSSDSDSDSGSFMIFVIGLLCGLTVVLSSLAIYNFLSHEPAKPDAQAKHDSTGHGDATDSHAEPADKSAPTDKHGTADKHEAPAKAKSH
jgi:hypothetical protein